MTLSVRCGYRKMQPIFFSFVSGLHYRKTVKLYFRRISTFYLVVSIYENSSFRRFLSFLTAGNKSKCGTLRRLTDPQQSTAEPILRPVSPPKRQATQGKSFVLSPISTQTSSHLRKHRTSVPSRPQKLPGALIHTTSAPNRHPRSPPAPPQIRMQFPNRSDSAIQSDTNKQAAQRELHAKLQHLRPLAGPVATPHGGHRAQAATHPDR